MGGLQPQLWRRRRESETRAVLPQLNNYPMGRWHRSRRGGHWSLTCAWREPDAALWLDRAVFVRLKAPKPQEAVGQHRHLRYWLACGEEETLLRGSAYLHDRNTSPYGVYMCMGWAAWTAETCSIASAWLHVGRWAGSGTHATASSGSVTARCWRFWLERVPRVLGC